MIVDGFSQKYSIVSFFEKPNEGFEFDMKDWPAHVTIADVFAARTDGAYKKLQNIAASQSSLKLKITGDAFFGHDKSVHVFLLDKTAVIEALHDKVVDVLFENGAVFNNPEFVREGFLPHTSFRDDIKISDIFRLENLAVIDMFPDSNPYRRKVIKVYSLDGPEV